MYKPIADVYKNELEFLIPGDADLYIELDVKTYVRGKFFSGLRKYVDFSHNCRGQ